jgi:cell division protein FtsB
MSSKKSTSNWSGLLVNKYFLALMAFLVWVCFFDNHNLLEQRKMSAAIDKLEGQIEGYEGKLENIIQEEKDLADNIEKLAREKYKFGAPNEDIFIIEPKKEN